MAAFVVVAVAFLAFVIDLGDQRQDRRQLTTATDAAALDVASDWADNSLVPLPSFLPISANRYDCTSSAQDFLARNREVDPGDYSCEAFFTNGQAATVTVTAEGSTEYEIAPAFGIDEGEIGSSTTVRISPVAGGGLRPFAVCALDVDVYAWFAAGGLPPNQQLTLDAEKFLAAECGQNNGNWGFIQFDSQGDGVGNTSGNGIAGTILRGGIDPVESFDDGDGNYDNEKQVCIDDYADNTPYDDQTPVTCLFEATGAGAWNNANTAAAFDQLILDGTIFNVPVYAERVDLRGSTTGYPVVAFAEVQLVTYAANGANDNSITLIYRKLISGQCCDINADNKLLEICDVGSATGSPDVATVTDCRVATTVSNPPPVFPPPADPCVVLDVSPLTATVAVTGNPSATASDVDYEVTVADSADCDGLEVAATGPGQDRSALVSTISATEMSARFAAGTRLSKNRTYTIEVRDSGTTLNDLARLTTTG